MTDRLPLRRLARAPDPCEPGALRVVYDLLYIEHGPQHWWPGDTPFEIMVGAILTQNTAWINVERAIANLKSARALNAHAILKMAPKRLARHLTPSGYFNVKTIRLKNLCKWFLGSGGFRPLRRMQTEALRRDLLDVHGIGPETADDILLYAFERPVFVIDAYTRRLFGRLGLLDARQAYEVLRACFENALGPDVMLFSEYHALIVRHAKEICRPKPRCDDCCLATRCQSGSPLSSRTLMCPNPASLPHVER